ncbi:Nramp family divalent metal transporter [soil metagenome]
MDSAATVTPTEPSNDGFKRRASGPSLAEAYRSVPIPMGMSWWKKLLAFAGPGYLVAVGYMDPGNWATDIGGGSKFGYMLLSVVLISNLMAIFLQMLCAKLGIATGRDLAQACRDAYSKPVSIVLWLFCEIAIAACDLAEVVGSALALELLFGIPMFWGVIITAADVLIVLALQGKGFRMIEALVIVLMFTIGGCLGYTLWFAKPSVSGVMSGFLPTMEILKNKEALYIAVGILGATVMPHNLYLHSSTVQTRDFGHEAAQKKEAFKFATIDSTFALMIALFINAAILIVAAASFNVRGMTGVAEIKDAYNLLTPTLGAAAASTLFAVALLAAGQNSTLTGTLAGQIVMEGFLNFKLPPWLRRMITRLIAIIPAAIVIGIYGESKVTDLLILSQVILSFQLPFAIIPLIAFTGDKRKMGDLVNRPITKWIGYSVAAIICVLNVWLLVNIATGK